MATFRKVWPAMALLLCFIRNSCYQAHATCYSQPPVVSVCTRGNLTSKVRVNIDTVSVRYTIITCRCVISTSNKTDTFVFEYSGNTEHIGFKLNNHYLNNTYKEEIHDNAVLIFFSTNDSIIANGCLNIYTEYGTRFNITCFPKTIRTTTGPVGPETSYSSGRITTDVARPTTAYFSSGITSVTDAKVEKDRKSESKLGIIIPVVATTAGVVCITAVVALVVICRRRSLAGKQSSNRLTTVAGKEKEEEYYMTENPMYNVTDAEQDIQSDEREYHYIEAENQSDGTPDFQYESIRDSAMIGQIHDKRDDLHYDYTTCTSSKNGHMLGNKVNQNNIKQTKVSEQESKLTEGDTMYDRTDTAAAKSYLNVNDYHHISPAASRKGTAMNTYDTCGDKSNARIT